MSRISDLAGFTTAISTTEDLSVGIITASSFSGNLTGDVTGTASLASNLTGTPDTTVNNLTGAAATFSGNVTIGGTLTYQDVEHIDSVGIITAQKGIQVLANGLDITGVGTFKSDVSIADKIIHTGDTNTAIRFPAADTFTVETGGTEAYRVDSSQRLLVGTNGDFTNGTGTKLQSIDSAGGQIALGRDNSSLGVGDLIGRLRWYGNVGGTSQEVARISVETDAAHGSDDKPGRITLHTTADGASSPTERLRVTSGGDVIVNGTVAGSSAKFEVQSTTGSLTSATARVDGGKTTTGAVNTGSSLLFAGHDGANGRDFASLFAGKENGTSGNHNAYLAFGTRVNGGAVTEKLRVTSTGGVHFNNAELIERVNITSGKLSDNQDINLDDGMAHLFTTAETTTATPNIRITTGINTHMAVGDVISVNIITTAAAAGYAATVHIDGVTVGTNGGSLVWNGGSAPSEGGSSGNDFYTYSIIKTASAKYTVLANVANFA